MANVKYPKKGGWIWCQDPQSPEYPWDSPTPMQDGDVIGPPRNTTTFGNFLSIGNYCLYDKDGDNHFIGNATTAGAIGSMGTSSAPVSTLTDGTNDTWTGTGAVVFLQNSGIASGKLWRLASGGTPAQLDVRGCMIRPSIGGKLYSAFATDVVYGSWGDAFDIVGGTLTFNPQGNSKALGVQVGAGGTPIFDRFRTSAGAKIKFAETPTSTKYAQVLCWSAYVKDSWVTDMGNSTTPWIQPNLGQFGTAAQSNGSLFWIDNTLTERCGRTRVTDTNSRGSVWFRKLRAFSSIDSQNIGLELISTVAADYTDSNTKRVIEDCAIDGLVIHTTTVTAGTADNGWDFIGSSRFGMYRATYNGNANNRTWQGVTRKADVDQGRGVIPAAQIVGEYLATARSGLGNEKFYVTNQGAGTAGGLLPVATWTDCYDEVADDTNSRGTDAGELLQMGGQNGATGNFESRDGWTFIRQRSIGARNGTAFRRVEMAYIRGNTTQPPATPVGRVIFQHCSGNAGPAMVGFAHQPIGGAGQQDAPGYDRVEMDDCLYVGTYANATGSTSPDFQNLTGPATIVGLINVNSQSTTADQALYVGGMDARSVRRCAFFSMRGTNPATQQPNPLGSITYAPGAAWDDVQRSDVSALDTGAKTEALLKSNNLYANPFAGRVANPSQYLNSLPGGGTEGPGRRIETLGAFCGLTGTGTGSAATDDLYIKSWRALFAQDLASHPALPGAHAWYCAGVSTSALRAWVDADWVPVNAALRGQASADSTGNTAPGAVAMAAAQGATVTGVTVTPTSLAGNPGGTAQITATVAGTNSPSQAVTYASNNSAVATVSGAGLVTYTGAGTATITATSVADGTKSATVSVTVTTASVTPTVSSVTVTPSSLAGIVGGTVQITAAVNGTNSPSQAVNYSSSNGSIASVSSTGTVTYLAPGSVSLTITSQADLSKTATVSVTVTAAGTPVLALRRSRGLLGATAGESGATADFTHVLNMGGGVLPTLAVSSDSAWLTGAIVNGLLRYTADPTGKAAGTYTGVLTVSGSGVTTQTFVVVMTVFGAASSPTNARLALVLPKVLPR